MTDAEQGNNQTGGLSGQGGRKRDYWSWAVLVLGVGAVLAFLVAALGTRVGLWNYSVGLMIVPWALLAALVAPILALIDYLRARKRPRGVRWPHLLIGCVAAVGLLIYLLPYLFAGLTRPAIHDISTDLANPPRFIALELREDNWDSIPGADDGDYRGMNPRQRWAMIHQDAYPDIRTVRVEEPMADVVERAERLAEDRGWDVALVTPRRGRMEATDTVSLFGFKDDVVLRARPVEGGAATVVDMRSVSRVGVSDLGVNAERIRDFLADLTGTTSIGAD